MTLKISVVVDAHLRKEFVERAVRSALEQAPHEVILVKCYEDDVLDARMERMGVIVVSSKEPFQGGKFADGLKTATGDVVAFLDDDDVFLPGKIPRLQEEFGRDRVDVHVNRYVPFTSSVPVTSRLETSHVQNVQDPRGPNPGIASCESVRRDLMERWDADLRKLVVADHALFFMALVSGRRVSMDPSVLTGYHLVQTGNVQRTANTIWNRPGASSLQDVRWLLDFLDRYGEERPALKRLVTSAVVNLVFLTGTTDFPEGGRTVRALLDGVGIRRPLVVPSSLMFLYPFAPKMAIRLARTWKDLVGYHHAQREWV
jgi:glycosyltransferase involved in cell wall biosynthesis